MGWFPEICMRQELMAVEYETKRKTKDELQVSLKEKEKKIGSKGKRHKSEKNLLKKE